MHNQKFESCKESFFMKKIMCIVFAVIMLCSMMAVPACADEGINPRASAYFTSYGANLAKQSDGRIKVTFTAVGTGVCSQLGVATYQVYELNSSGGWSAYTSLLAGKTGSGVTSYTFSKYFTPVAGNSYYVSCTFISAINGGVETKSYTSGVIKA